MIPLEEAIGVVLRVVRMQRDMSQQEVAYRLGELTGCHRINPGYVDDIETGKRKFSLKRMAAFCAVLRCMPSALIRVAEEFQAQAEEVEQIPVQPA